MAHEICDVDIEDTMTREEALHNAIVELEALDHRLEEAGKYSHAISAGTTAAILQRILDEQEDDAHKCCGATEPR